MITVHHLENSQSIRILWLLEELGMDYNIKHYERNKRTSLASPEFKKLHPVGTSPIITDGELVLPETNAIIQYILDRVGDHGLVPEVGSPERISYLYWLHAAQGSIVPLMYMQLVIGRLAVRVPFFLKPMMRKVVAKTNQSFLNPKLNNFLSLIEQHLSQHTWFAGETFTVADIVMGYCMEVAVVRSGMDSRYPNAQRFLTQMRERPAYKMALEKNGVFEPLAF